MGSVVIDQYFRLKTKDMQYWNEDGKGGRRARRRYEARKNKELLEMKAADPNMTRAKANKVR